MRLIIHIAAARLPDAQWMYAGSLPGVVNVLRNVSGTDGSGDAVLNGMLKNLIPASSAAAAFWSMFAPCSVGTRRLMIDATPIFFNSGPASAVVAPPHATVVSRRAKFVTPGTDSLVTFCASAGATANDDSTRTSESQSLMCSPFQKRQFIIVHTDSPVASVHGK